MEDLSEFADYYLHVLGRKPSTTTRHVERLRTWEKVTGKAATEIESLDVIAYLRENPLNHAGNTKKGMLVSIQSFHRYESATGRKTLNGICDIATPSIRDEEWIPPLELRHARPLLDACRRPLEFRLIWFGLYLGTRIGESAQIHGTMWKEGVIWLKGEKTDRVHPIPVHPELEEKMWDALASPPTDPSTLQRVRRRMTERTGIKFRSHQLRKRFAQSLSDTGVDKGTRQDLLGHRTVTDIYSTPNISGLREAVSRLRYKGDR